MFISSSMRCFIVHQVLMVHNCDQYGLLSYPRTNNLLVRDQVSEEAMLLQLLLQLFCFGRSFDFKKITNLCSKVRRGTIVLENHFFQLSSSLEGQIVFDSYSSNKKKRSFNMNSAEYLPTHKPWVNVIL